MSPMRSPQTAMHDRYKLFGKATKLHLIVT